MMKSQKTPKRIKEKQLIRIFQDFKRLTCRENCFCFLLGAGASKSSGIPTGNELCQKWYEELKEDLREESDLVKEWENKVGVTLDPEHVGQFYPFLYTKRYENSPHLGYEELKSLMDKKEPSIGYLILAQILAEGMHRFVVTTNFDALIEDAIRMHTAKRPLVAGHETLAEYISLQDDRPTIIKIHRDLLLHPFNDEARTSFLQEEWKKALSPLLKNFCMLVVGYGGNDGSLMDYLKAIDPSDRKSIYWCIRKESDLPQKASELLTEKDYVVEIEGFDELMFALNDTLKFNIFDNLDQPEQHPFVAAAIERVKAVAEKRKEILEKLSQRNGEKISSAVETIMTGATAYIFKAYLQKENDKKEQIYLKGLKKYPESVELLTAYADWLDDMKRYPEALEIYSKAIKIAPSEGDIYNNWGNVLQKIAVYKDGEEGEKLYEEAIAKYRKSIELEPDSADAYYNWGTVLQKLADRKGGIERKKLYEESIAKYRKSIELEPDSADAYNNWGTVLQDLARYKSGEEKEGLYKKSIAKYRKSIELEPDNADSYNNWGSVLQDLARYKSGKEKEGLYKKSITKYRKSIELEPDSADAYNNWGAALQKLADRKEGIERKKLYEESIAKYRKSIELQPDSAGAYCNWGAALQKLADCKEGIEREKLYEEAIEKYRKAIELQLDSAGAYCNWGTALQKLADRKEGIERKKLYEESIAKYRKAIELQPDYVNAYDGWGKVLRYMAEKEERKVEKKSLYQQAVEKLLKGVELGGRCYNLACLYALLKDKKNALQYLEQSLSKKEKSTDFVLQDKDWKDFLQAPEFLKVIEKYKSQPEA